MQGGGGAVKPHSRIERFEGGSAEWAAMTGEANDKTSPKQVKSDRRRTRLGQQLRANLLKRKAQVEGQETAPRWR